MPQFFEVTLPQEVIDILKPHMRKDNILEVVSRDKKKKYKVFHNLIIQNAPGSEAQAQAAKIMDTLNNNLNLADMTHNLMKNVAKFQKVSLAFNALNLCATCAGFIVMFNKLDRMSAQIDKLMGVVKQGTTIEVNYQWRKVLSEHANMLDCRKTQNYYSEEQMRKLVDDEYNVLLMLIEGFMKNHTDDLDNLIVSMYSMAAMMTVSLRYFDELYYMNHKDIIGDGDIWHSSHTNWTSVYDKLLADEFLELIQDHGMFDMGLSIFETEEYYVGLCDQVKEMKETIEDNQMLLLELKTPELMDAFEKYVDREIIATIDNAIEQTEGANSNPALVEAYRKSMKQMALGA